MTREMVLALTDAELDQVSIWASEEKQERAARRKQDTIAKIRDLAALAGVQVKIAGARGRPAAMGQSRKGRNSRATGTVGSRPGGNTITVASKTQA